MHIPFARYGALIIVLVCSSLVGPARAGSTPQAYFDQSAPSGSGDTLNVYRVPVLTSTGTIVYKDVQIQFDVSATGGLTLHSGSPTVTTSQTLLTSDFIAGKFTLDGTYYSLTGPGAGLSGRSSWSFAVANGSSACLQSAGWTTGAISGNPLQSRLNAAKITYAGYAYGVLGSVPCSGDGIPSGWNSGYLIGAAATGNGLTIYRYTNNSGVDQSSPVDSVSFSRCPASGSC